MKNKSKNNIRQINIMHYSHCVGVILLEQSPSLNYYDKYMLAESNNANCK